MNYCAQGLKHLTSKLVVEDNLLIKIISDYKDFNCDFIIDTKEFKDLDNTFKSFFGLNFSYNKLIKLNYKCYLFNKYIIKLKDINYPNSILNINELVKSYLKENYIFESNNKILYLGVEIQDYIENESDLNESDLESIWYSLYKKGYMWADAKLDNIVKNNNKIYIIDTDYIYKIEEYDSSNESFYSNMFRLKYKKQIN